MTSFWVTMGRLLLAFVHALRDHEFRALFLTFVSLLVSGTVFYSAVEGWSVIDSLYFCVITLATVGYGELHPTTPISKLFTIAYLLVGIGVFLGVLNKLNSVRDASREKRGSADADGKAS